MSTLLRNKKKARFAVCADRKSRMIMLTMDGKLVKKWSDSTGLKGDGKGVLFVTQSSGMTRLSNMQIAKWDGKVPKGNNRVATADSDRDIIGTSNGGDLTGVLHGFRGGKIHFDATESVGSELSVSLDKVNFLSFAGAKPEKRKLEIGDVRGTFSTGGDFIFRLESWTADRVIGMHPAIGKVDFDPIVFSALQLNLNKRHGD